ncbi:hypothetical protein BCV69DRAFT_202998 [Microstroma glucosiphilum]|uniref:Uncharacterized protein n=1 Tax=Pseudomicrostroma glucosiphilum TaxID=1684307 RepID=A0A316U4V1_9BASI|nr:hypothetical protein BCV69DRAFT_202998 [Pseudomicrostroma glucosiphilum]PWN20210.1 hypothetical protein BCV69DRAFT_202998 [Pseudomicrostroma glucosiphilum]
MGCRGRPRLPPCRTAAGATVTYTHSSPPHGTSLTGRLAAATPRPAVSGASTYVPKSFTPSSSTSPSACRSPSHPPAEMLSLRTIKAMLQDILRQDEAQGMPKWPQAPTAPARGKLMQAACSRWAEAGMNQ